MEKIRLYLGTNMVIDLFINQARSFKSDSEFIEAIEPKKFRFMLEHLDKFEFITSVLAKAEITRELVTAFHLSGEEVERLWASFVKSLNSRYIDSFTVNEQLVGIVSKMKMKLRTMMNFQHVFVAVQENAYFVSGDKDIIAKIRDNKVYDKALTYIELRELASSLH